MFHMTRVVKFLMESCLMSNGVKVTVKILPIVMIHTFC